MKSEDEFDAVESDREIENDCDESLDEDLFKL
jgi:hypothetical protein